jgi:hypothetical protein
MALWLGCTDNSTSTIDRLGGVPLPIALPNSTVKRIGSLEPTWVLKGTADSSQVEALVRGLDLTPKVFTPNEPGIVEWKPYYAGYQRSEVRVYRGSWSAPGGVITLFTLSGTNVVLIFEQT